jgi:hypothetical protein
MREVGAAHEPNFREPDGGTIQILSRFDRIREENLANQTM